MKIPVKFYKVANLPTRPRANTFYFIENKNVAEAYLTNENGEAKYIGNSTMIRALNPAGGNGGLADPFSLQNYISARGLINEDDDCSPAILDALSVMEVLNGGKLTFPNQSVRFSKKVLRNLANARGSYHFVGSGTSSVIKFKQDASDVNASAMKFQNTAAITFDRMTVFNGGGSFDTENYLFDFEFVKYVTFKHCEFLALAAKKGIIRFFDSRLFLEKCRFGGCIALQKGVIHGERWVGYSQKATEFLDHGQYGVNAAVDKLNGQFAEAWVLLEDALPHGDNYPTVSRAVIDDGSVFDENHAYAVKIVKAESVVISGANINSGHVQRGGEIVPSLHFEDVKRVKVIDSFNGYVDPLTQGNACALRAKNCEELELDNFVATSRTSHVHLIDVDRLIVKGNTRLRGDNNYPNGIRNEKVNKPNLAEVTYVPASTAYVAPPLAYVNWTDSVIADFNPATIAGAANNDQVAAWASGVGTFSYSEATAGKRPVFKTNIAKGKPAVSFDAVDDSMDINQSIHPAGAPLTKFSVAIVGVPRNDTAFLRVLNAVETWFLTFARQGAPSTGLFYQAYAIDTGVNSALNIPRILLAQVDTVAEQAKLFAGDGADLTLNGAGGALPTFVHLGSSNSASYPEPVGADVLRIIFFNDILSTGERNSFFADMNDLYVA